MSLKKGIAHLLLIVIVGALIIGFWFAVYKFVLKGKIPFLKSKEPQVELKTDYKNPFKKDTQYVNPFEEFKNPIANLK